MQQEEMIVQSLGYLNVVDAYHGIMDNTNLPLNASRNEIEDEVVVDVEVGL